MFVILVKKSGNGNVNCTLYDLKKGHNSRKTACIACFLQDVHLTLINAQTIPF